jgi:peptidyl-prolyl cis-trans isomerase D
MLEVFRKEKVKKVIFWLLAILIVPAFAMFGVSYLNTQKKYIATMYGKKIYNSDFLDYQKMFGAYLILNFGQDAAKEMNSDAMVNHLWENFMLTEKSRRAGIKVSDQELVEFLKTFFMLNMKGQFEKPMYLGFLKQAGIVPAQFETFIKGMIASQKLVKQRMSGVTVSDAEALESFKNKNEQAKIAYIFVSERETQQWLEQSTDEATLKSFYDKDPALFKTLPEAQIQYVCVGELPKDFDATKMKSLEDAANALKAEIKTTPFFTEKDAVGELGMQEFIAKEAIAGKKDVLVGPVPTDKGSVLFKKIADKQPDVPAFGNTKDRVAKKYAFTNAVAKAEEIAKDVFTAAQAGDFAAAAAKYAFLKNTESAYFKAFDEIDDRLLFYPPFNKAVFDLKDNAMIEKPFRFDYGWAIAKRLDFKAYDAAQFDKEKEQVKNELMATRKELEYKKLLEEIKESSGITINPQDQYLPESARKKNAEPITIDLNA